MVYIKAEDFLYLSLNDFNLKLYKNYKFRLE